MKNYDIKSATADLSLKQKIVLKGKRLAFLVSNMFKRVSLGFTIKKNLLEANLANKRVENAEKEIEKREAIAPLREEAVAQRDAIVARKIIPIDEKIGNKEAAIDKVNNNDNIDADTKRYIIKAYKKDIEKLEAQKSRVSRSPRRLLISAIFLQKLVVNRKNKLIKTIEDRIVEQQVGQQLKKIEEVSAKPTEDSSFQPATKQEAVVENHVEDINLTEDEKRERAKQKYLELNEARLKLIDELRERQTRIKDIQIELSKLVTENGLTQDMFEKEKKVG